MMDIKECPLCWQEVKLEQGVLEGDFLCPRCKSQVYYTIQEDRIKMDIHAPEDIDRIMRKYR